MPRIALAGFQHETNTFAPIEADWSAFVAADAWPGLVRGEEIAGAVARMNLPIAGAMAALSELGHDTVPIAWAAAQPSAHVAEDAFERMAALIVDGLEAASPLDGLYLDLHGAMVTTHLDDGEGALLRRLRHIVGPDLPIAASLDLHANVSAVMVDAADVLVGYRTYPHVDMAATGDRAARALDALIRTRRKPYKSFHQLDFLIPLVWQCTFDEPAKGLYRRLAAIERESGALLSFCTGFPLADIADCGPSVLACAADINTAEAAALEMVEAVHRARGDFAGRRTYDPASAVAEGLRRAAAGAGRPVILADSADNPGAGATCGTVAVLVELIRQRARGAIFGLLFDPAAARAAHAAGEGARCDLVLGAESRVAGDRPVAARFRVERLGDGRFTGTGPFYKGARMDLGPMALVRHEASGVLAALTSRKQQAADRAMFRHLGVAPEAAPLLVLKSSVHYRADFEPIAEALLVVDGPGAAPLEPASLPYRKLRPGVALGPAGPVFGGVA